MKGKKTVIIISVSSDIGLDLAKRFLEDGCRVIGTYRHYGRLKEVEEEKQLGLIKCDVESDSDISQLIKYCSQKLIKWDIFVSSVGDLHPLTGFFQSKFSDWEKSVRLNAVSTFRILHGLYPLRNKDKISDVVFLAGGGVNKAVVNMSAYTISKIMLIKMCEFLDAECPDLNVFAVGPGWTRTKIHQTVLSDPDVSLAKYEETVAFLKDKKGTSLKDIYDCIVWLCKSGKEVAGGRNFSVVHDKWKGKESKHLKIALLSDPNMYKLRRFKNEETQS